MSSVIQVDFGSENVQVGDVISIPGLDGWFKVLASMGDKIEVVEIDEADNPKDCA